MFGLYLALQQFYKVGSSVFSKTGITRTEEKVVVKVGSVPLQEEKKTLVVEEGEHQFHTWFIRVVAIWLDIALYKAMVRIVRAVRLDSLKPVSDSAGHSSSAIDICTVLGQIRTFWGQLSWPDVETSYVFISRIMDDVCKAVIFYAEKMIGKASEEEEGEEALGCYASHCLALNNIDFVMAHMATFVQELGTQEVLNQLEKQKGTLVASACRKTIRTVLKNSMENVENQILAVVEHIGNSARPLISRFLNEVPAVAGGSRPDLLPSLGEDGRQLLRPLDTALVFLREKLVAANFSRVISVLWATSVSCLSTLLHESIRRRKQPNFFVALHSAFQVLMNFLYGDSTPPDSSEENQGGLEGTQRLLTLFASSPISLVDAFYRERLKEQEAIGKGNFPQGAVTVKVLRLSSHIRVQVVNCRHLRPLGEGRRSMRRKQSWTNGQRGAPGESSTSHTGSNQTGAFHLLREKCQAICESVAEAREESHRAGNRGMCCPYVTIKVVPGDEDCAHLAKARTAAHTRTLFPVFGETLDLVLPEDSQTDSSMLLFSVKDLGPLGDSLPLGEALLPLHRLPPASVDASLVGVQEVPSLTFHFLHQVFIQQPDQS